MTPRPLARTRRSEPWRRIAALALLMSAAVGLLGLTGCDPRQAMFFLQPFEPTVPGEGPSLKAKRVAVIAKAAPGALNDFATLDHELTREVVNRLREKVKKIDVVDPDRVWEWDEAHPNWTNPDELAEAFDVDAVVYLEVNNFQVQDPSSPGLFEGRSAVHIRVIERAHPKDSDGKEQTDRPKETSVIFDADEESTFPERGPIPASAEVNFTAFKAKFLKLVATEVSWHFTGHAPGDNIQDTRFN